MECLLRLWPLPLPVLLTAAEEGWREEIREGGREGERKGEKREGEKLGSCQCKAALRFSTPCTGRERSRGWDREGERGWSTEGT